MKNKNDKNDIVLEIVKILLICILAYSAYQFIRPKFSTEIYQEMLQENVKGVL